MTYLFQTAPRAAPLLAGALLAAACLPPLAAQEAGYGGPSVLSRPGPASNAIHAPVVFRPFLSVAGIYDSGLTGTSVDSNGKLISSSSEGVEGQFGVYGFHATRHTTVGLNYRGDVRHYTQNSYYDGSDHTLDLAVNHELSRHVSLSLVQTAGTFSRTFGMFTGAGLYNPNFLPVPNNELFDNRTFYLMTAADLTWQKTARLSFNFGGSGALVRRRSTALFGVTVSTARADMAYRLTRHTTVGVDYSFVDMQFTKAFGSTNMHGVAANWAWRISRDWELAGRAGAYRMESLMLRTVALDPAVAAILGQSQGVQIGYNIDYAPIVGARLSRKFRRAELSFSYDRSVTPGNGVYLTSRSENAGASYSYTGLRRWSLTAGTQYSSMDSFTQENIGTYNGYSAGCGATRSLMRNDLYVTARFDVRRYTAGYAGFNRNFYRFSLTFSYSPGDMPLAFW